MTTRVPARVKGMRPGDPITAFRQTQLSDGVNALSRAPAFIPKQVLPEAEIQVPEFRVAAITEIEGDYLFVEFAEGVDAGEVVACAKPPPFRASFVAHDGNTFVPNTLASTRVANPSGENESQVLTPAYVVGDQILIAGPVAGGTGLETLEGEAVEWVELNTWGRAWALDESS